MIRGAGISSEQSTSETGYIASVLASSNLKLRNGKLLTRNMVTAIQPLSIDGVEICTDRLLAEFVEYQTAARLVRETDTLTLKKTAYSAFEATMTPIPKYCFNDVAARKTVLVHSVSRFTLEDVLQEVEKVYERPSAFTVSGFIADWVKLIKSRVNSTTKAGRLRLVRMLATAPALIFPLPKRLPKRERKSFASSIFATVLEHHQRAIYHDCIVPRTIFYPTPQKPQLLSNYAGVPSSMLADYLPIELMGDDAALTYGPHCRDVYCCALIGYRILTGEVLDGRTFTLASPRPLRLVLRTLAKKTGLTFTIKNVSSVKQMVVSLAAMAKELVLLLPKLFTRRSFATWQKINCTAGGYWRKLPVIGPLCNVIAPAKAANLLRQVLDRSWFLQSIIRKDSAAGHRHHAGMESLYRAFAQDTAGEYPHFTAVLDGLNSETVLKRTAFGSVMGSGHARKKRVQRLKVAVKGAAIVLTTLIVITGLLLLPEVLRNTASVKQVPASHPVPPEVVVRAENQPVPGLQDVAPQPVVSDSPNGALPHVADTSPAAASENASVNMALPVAKKRVAVKKRSRKPAGQVVSIAAAKKDVVKKTQDSVVRSDTAFLQQKDTVDVIPVIPRGLLSPVSGKKEILIVAGIPDSCNPGKLYYSPDGQEGGIMFCQLPKVARRLYLARKLPKGFGSIETIRLCQSGGCDRTMYYEPVGVEGIGKPIFVRSGDAISQSRLKLWQYVQGM